MCGTIWESKTLKNIFLAALLCAAGFSAGASESSRLHLLTESSPPSSMRSGTEVIGSGASAPITATPATSTCARAASWSTRRRST